MQEQTARPGESLGWRIKETKQGLSIEAVWCLHTGTGWKHRKADVKTVLQHGSLLKQDSDVPLLRLTQLQDAASTSAMLQLRKSIPGCSSAVVHRILGSLSRANSLSHWSKTNLE